MGPASSERHRVVAVVAAAVAVTGAAVCAGAIGCAPARRSLVPAQAQRGAEVALAAREVAGVGVAVIDAAWDGYPASAAGAVTPIQITLRNGSGKPLLVRWRDFTVIGASGQRYPALPPVPPEPPRAGMQVFAPVFSAYGFGVSQDFALYFPTFPTAYDPLPLDRAAQRAAYAAWPAGLPTQDIREHALPEGVLEHHGTITGYLYFPDVTSHETRVSFEAHMLAAPRGEPFATAALDFRVR
jgi:hypothetical protein